MRATVLRRTGLAACWRPVDNLNRQAEANEQLFTTLTAAGDYTASAFGIPPGISQLGMGMLLAFGGRAGWLRLKRPPQSPPKPRSAPLPTTDPPVSA